MLISTLRAILAPRRILPVALVSFGLAVAEYRTSGEPWGALVALLMCAAFVVVGPASWRLLFGDGAERDVPLLVRAVAYLTIGGATVLGLALVPASLGMRANLLTDSAGLPVTLVLFWVGGWGLGRDVDLVARNAQLLRAAEQAQLLALRSQLDPHFLFNTLNAIAEWCREDPEVAEEATLKLAAMLRTIFEGVKTQRWSLARDVALATELWTLHHARDPERFSYRVEVDDVDDVSVPPLLLLPLAENAMTHGVWGGHRGEVTLEIAVDDQVEVRIENPGAFEGERDGGHGLDSVRRRLALTWGDAASLELCTVADQRTRATLRFPRRGSSPRGAP